MGTNLVRARCLRAELCVQHERLFIGEMSVCSSTTFNTNVVANFTGAAKAIHADRLRWVNPRETNRMWKLVSGLVVATAVALSGPAVAAPGAGQAGLASAIEDSGAELLQQVLHGCGAGWWRGPDAVGRCRPMRRRGVIVAPPVVIVPGRGWCHRRPWSGGRVRC